MSDEASDGAAPEPGAQAGKAGKGTVAPEEMEAAGDLDPARVFVSAGGERARKEAGARVYFELK